MFHQSNSADTDKVSIYALLIVPFLSVQEEGNVILTDNLMASQLLHNPSLMAHVASDGRIQSLNDHAEGVARRCAQFLTEVGHPTLAPLGELLGWLHDLGKAQPEFQTYLRKVAIEKTLAPKAPHSMVGASYASYEQLTQTFPAIFSVLAYVISGHHRGLYDYDELEDKLHSSETGERTRHSVEDYKIGFGRLMTFLHQHGQTVEQYLQEKTSSENAQAMVRLCFSCLIDADFLDTEEFMGGVRQELRKNTTSGYDSLYVLHQRLSAFTAKFKADSPVNATRAQFLATCRQHGSQCELGYYSLFLPTGGGKTLSSMAWALETALHLGMRRIIYVIPYTSIITQTAQVFKQIFGEHNVLEHHSEFEESVLSPKGQAQGDSQHATVGTATETESYSPYRLICENWDAPIIVTTNVRFFESAFSHKVSASRKMHNVARSVIVFDEVQQFPNDLLNPVLHGLDNLHEIYHCQCLFCSATLPSFDRDHNSPFKQVMDFYALRPPLSPIVQITADMMAPFERVQYHLQPISLTYVQLAERLLQHDSGLCIVNTRKEAAVLYQELLQQGAKAEHLVHLSRNMCSEHLKTAITAIRERMAGNVPTLVVSTQLIEAGVDLDFPVVFRAKTGLDGIIQAGGRCNREGKRAKQGEVFVVDLIDGGQPQGDCREAVYATQELLLAEGADYSESRLDYIQKYYELYFKRIKSFDEPRIASRLWRKNRAEDWHFDFETAGQEFKIIEEQNKIDVVLKDDSLVSLIESLRHHKIYPSRRLLRGLQPFRIAVGPRQFVTLCDAGWIEKITLGLGAQQELYFLHPDGYDAALGVRWDNPFAEATLIG